MERVSLRPTTLLLVAPLPLLLLSSAASSAQQPTQMRFKAVESMIVVPVTINGSGPFDFQVDTGGTSSTVDKELADELQLPLTGTAFLDAARGETTTTVAHINSMTMTDASVTGMDVLVVDRWAGRRLKVRGVLGEDFLRNFDVFIDNRHHLIRLEKGPGPMGNQLVGEHLPLSTCGLAGEKLEPNRLVIVGRLYGFGNKDAKLQLDSGVGCLMLLSQADSPDGWTEPIPFAVTDALGESYSAHAYTSQLRLGKRLFDGVTVIMPTKTIMNRNVDGLLPTSLFQSIFISHSGRFVILNPSVKSASVKTALAESKPPSRSPTEISCFSLDR